MANRQPLPKVGYTLVELLIVIVIALLLMVVSLPTLKSVMEDARPREASRILNTMVFTAKARAAQSGNPAGIEFVYDPNAVAGSARCTQMYMCEIPPIYAGDTTNARVTVDTSMSPWVLNFSSGSADSLPSLLDASNQFWIRINHRGPWYTVNSSSGYRIQPTAVRPPTSDPNGYSFQIRHRHDLQRHGAHGNGVLLRRRPAYSVFLKRPCRFVHAGPGRWFSTRHASSHRHTPLPGRPDGEGESAGRHRGQPAGQCF